MSLVADSKKKKDGKNRTGRKIVIEKIIERKERLQPDFQIFIGWSDQSGYSRPNCLWVPGVGGYTLIFSAYVGLDPASSAHPKKISGILSTPKKYLKFWQPKKISQFCTLTLKKTLNCIEMALKLAQFCDDPKKISTKSSYPKICKPQKILKFRILNPKKWAEPTYV